MSGSPHHADSKTQSHLCITRNSNSNVTGDIVFVYDFGGSQKTNRALMHSRPRCTLSSIVVNM
jgi:hypothetical protein